MVADKVQVCSKSAHEQSDIGVMWESTGEEKYKLKEIEKSSNGTDIIIYLNEESKEFSEQGRVKFLLEKKFLGKFGGTM